MSDKTMLEGLQEFQRSFATRDTDTRPETFASKARSVGFTGHRITRGATRDDEKHARAELDAYDRAVAEGSQPWGTTMAKVEEAFRESDKLGRPFNAANLAETYGGPGTTEMFEKNNLGAAASRPASVQRAIDTAGEKT